MKALRLRPLRYQLNKEAAHAVLTGHPWIYRKHLSTASGVFKQGQWLRLHGGANEVLGYGVYENTGLIGIRVVKVGKNEPGPDWFQTRVIKALARRQHLRQYTDAFRAIHGENDGFPGVVIDIYGNTAVLQTYSPTVDGLGRYLAGVLKRDCGYANLIWKLPVKRKDSETPVQPRVLRGKIPETIKFREGALGFAVQVGHGQKSGGFLDLRGLRKWISLQKWDNKRVLNLFAYTGTLGRAAGAAHAKEVWNVDIAEAALEFGKKHHQNGGTKYKWLTEDIFKWAAKLPPRESFDVIIVDPPLMASRMIQVPNALGAYRKLYGGLLPHVAVGGTLIACCCTSRITPKVFRQEMDRNVGKRFVLVESLRPEDDHPVGFPEGDYLKMLIYRAKK